MTVRVVAFVDHEIGYQLLKSMVLFAKTAPFEIAAVVTTQENGQHWWPAVAPLAKENALPVYVYESGLENILALTEIDYCLLLSWKHVVPDALLQFPKRGTVNLHYSLLPEFRGVYPVNWALMEGKQQTGVTYHLVNEKIDAGPVLLQETVEIASSDTARTLQLKMDVTAERLFRTLLQQLVRGQLEQREPVAAVMGSYRSRNAFKAAQQLDLNKQYTGKEWLDLLRGMSFREDSRNAFFIDAATGQKIYVSIALNPEDAS